MPFLIGCSSHAAWCAVCACARVDVERFTSGMKSKWIDPCLSASGSAAFKFWYCDSTKKGVNGAIILHMIIKTS